MNNLNKVTRTSDGTLPNCSIEQQTILDALAKNQNVIVNSVAGSGKTTCNLHIASKFSELKVLLLTYNSKLKIETRDRAEKLQLSNLEIHSYHSFCLKYYIVNNNGGIITDTEIKHTIDHKYHIKKPLGYDIIIIDEAQDMSLLYFQFVCKLFQDNNNPNVLICIIGDENQSIFDFQNADQRFITFADQIFTFNSFEWTKCQLNQSFRITHEMAEFLNNCVLNYERIQSKKTINVLPNYLLYDTQDDKSDRLYKEVIYYLNNGYKPDDIFILAPSLKRGTFSAVCNLENRLKRHKPGLPIFVPTCDDTKLDSDVLKGKLVFSSFHQSKGLERKVVFVFNFDDSYFKYYKKDADLTVCPNELYVATTRASEHLILIHNKSNDYLPFLTASNISECIWLCRDSTQTTQTTMRQFKKTKKRIHNMSNGFTSTSTTRCD